MKMCRMEMKRTAQAPETTQNDVKGRRQSGDGRAAEDVHIDLLQGVNDEGGYLRQQSQTENERKAEQDVEQDVAQHQQLPATAQLQAVDDDFR